MSIAVEIVEIVAKNANKIAASGAMVSGGVAIGYAVGKHNESKKTLEEKRKSYNAGLKKGAEIGVEVISESIFDATIARVALAYYIAKVDGKIDSAEQNALDSKLSVVIGNPDTPTDVKKEIKSIIKRKEIKFEDIVLYLDKVDIATVSTLMLDVYDIAKASEGITEKEKYALDAIEQYVEIRMAEIDNVFHGENLVEKKIEKEIRNATDKYSLKMKMLEASFAKKTKLSYKESVLLSSAILLQLLRIYMVKYMTTIEKAGNKNVKENFLHKKQERILKKFDDGRKERPSEYYAPLNQIIFGRGVPYDATKYKDVNKGLFKGANHRFATLGHDPIIGLIVGTINIMTNTITTVNSSPVPNTYHVNYDEFIKYPSIGGNASLVYAINKAVDRSRKDCRPLVAAFIKQLIHIATDLYTPAGIQLPGANLVLTNEMTEMITRYVDTGDVIKTGTSHRLTEVINKLIIALHGCMLIEAGEDLNDKTNIIKAKKILLYSNSIVESSNVVKNTITQNYANMDWGGAISLLTKAFNDINFIYDVKREFISRGLGEYEI